MSQQLRFSATVSALTMALFALTAVLGGMEGGSIAGPSLEAPAIYSASIGK
ncbi:MAG: hypothetical protein H6913_01665 [Altererythrobacter sp.]|nr:hypothetical protein [Altererythrobacter sp.]